MDQVLVAVLEVDLRKIDPASLHRTATGPRGRAKDQERREQHQAQGTLFAGQNRKNYRSLQTNSLSAARITITQTFRFRLQSCFQHLLCI
jgi:hypothetical protein